MKNTLLVSILLLALMSGCASQHSRTAKQADGLTLRISVPSMTLKPHGELPAFLILSNGGFQSIRFTKLCTPIRSVGPGDRFDVGWIAGFFVLHPNWTKANELIESVQTLKPGKTAQLPFDILVGTNKTMYVTARYGVDCSLSDSLRDAGDYQEADALDKRMNLWKGTVTAKPLILHIK